MNNRRLLVLGVSAGSFAGCIYLGHMSVTAMRESPFHAAHHGPALKRLVGEVEYKKFLDKGILVIDHAISEETLQLIRNEVTELMSTPNTFDKNDNNDATIRSDIVLSVYENIGLSHLVSKFAGIQLAHRAIRSIPAEMVECGLDASLYGVPMSSQLACYDGKGTNYVAHKDCPDELTFGRMNKLLQPGLQDRRLTIILYLNGSTWNSSVGESKCDGNLRCYLNTKVGDDLGDTADEIIDIEPIGGRMVIFDSRRILHEVMPTSTRRVALTSWVGGDHSQYEWLRNWCVPMDEINWAYLKPKFWFY